jgi:hypothetical protein
MIGQPHCPSKESPAPTVCHSWSVCFEQEKNVCPSWDQNAVVAAFSKGCSKYYCVVTVCVWVVCSLCHFMVSFSIKLYLQFILCVILYGNLFRLKIVALFNAFCCTWIFVLSRVEQRLDKKSVPLTVLKIKWNHVAGTVPGVCRTTQWHLLWIYCLKCF